jgi:pyruvate/2-oxoglutarate/acetoin dehydrogenase E1 component
MTYKDALHHEMLKLAVSPKVRFIGYNTKCGHQMYGTLKGCEESCLEMPVAENLMVGVGIGLSLEGYLPVICIERADFLLACADAIINHVCALQKYGMKPLPMIIRVTVGTNYPLDPGFQHVQDHTELFRKYLPVFEFRRDITAVNMSMRNGFPFMIVDRKELYEQDCPAE